VDWTGALRINYSANQTGALWSLNAFRGVDTTTNNGIVQQATGTGNSTTPLATLSAYGSANNVGFAAIGASGTSGTVPTATTTWELSDNVPGPQRETQYAFNDTTMDGTITSAQWGAAAVEIKSLGTGAITIPAMVGWLGFWIGGTTATVLRQASTTPLEAYTYQHQVGVAGLPELAVPATSSGAVVVMGFTNRASP